MNDQMKAKMMEWRGIAALVGVGLLAAALIQELSRPRDERTWSGHVFGLVPYDLRPPDLERIKKAWWNPDSDRILADRAFGVGWSLNLGGVARRVGIA